MDINKINEIFKEIAQYRNMKAEIENTLEVLENEIKDFMKSNGETELIGDEHKALYKEVANNRFDSKAFKADMPELAEQYMRYGTKWMFNFK